MTASMVTGAGRGIGRATALALARSGHQVVVTGRTADTVRKTADEVGGTAVVGDVADPEHIGELAELTRHLGGVQLLVNNAGLADTPGTFLEADRVEWWRVVETNLRGPMLTCHALLPQMVERGSGRVVNFNSMGGMRPFTVSSAYSVSKAGVARLTDILAASLENTGVFVFDLSPGLVHTDMADSGGLFAEVPRKSGPRWTTRSRRCSPWRAAGTTRSPVGSCTPPRISTRSWALSGRTADACALCQPATTTRCSPTSESGATLGCRVAAGR